MSQKGRAWVFLGCLFFSNYLFSQDFKPINPLEVIQFETLHLLQDPNGRMELVIRFNSQDGFSLYTDKVSFLVPATLSRIRTYTPAAIKQFDETLGKEVEVYEPGHFRLIMQAAEPLESLDVSIKFTACTTSICLFPATWTKNIPVMQSDEDIEDEAFDKAFADAAAVANAQDEAFVPTPSYRIHMVIALFVLSTIICVAAYYFLPKFLSLIIFFAVLFNVYFFYQTKELTFEWHLAKHSEDLREQTSSYDFSLIYYSADWCLTCKRMELLTFKDDDLFEELKHFHKIKVDLTEESGIFTEFTNKDNVDLLPTLVMVGDGGQRRKKLSGYYIASSLKAELKAFREGTL
jgi:thiol:disulfide interchange protein